MKRHAWLHSAIAIFALCTIPATILFSDEEFTTLWAIAMLLFAMIEIVKPVPLATLLTIASPIIVFSTLHLARGHLFFILRMRMSIGVAVIAVLLFISWGMTLPSKNVRADEQGEADDNS